MKSYILFLSFLLPNIISAQIINHFNNSDSKWNVAKTYIAPTQQHPRFVATTTTVYGYNGDTMINNDLWFKLYSTNDSLFQKNLKYLGITRTENNAVLFIDTLNKLDTLYNFNLNVGDSFAFKFNNLVKLPVIKIDSIELNGKFYKRIKFEEPPFTAFDWLYEEWIEGIGSIHGPLFPKHTRKFSEEQPDSMHVTCTFSDNQQIYKRPTYKSCYINITLGLSKQETFNFKIYPNPFTKYIQIENSKNEDLELIILNSLGQVVLTTENNSNNITINLSELIDGVYFLAIHTENSTNTVKIIKK